MKKLLFIFFIAVSSIHASLPKPYSELKTVLAKNNHGWFGNGPQLDELFKKQKIEKIIEVGSWLGLSTFHMAKMLPNNGKIYAVDHWVGSVEHTSDELKDMLPTLYEQFLSNVIHEKLTDKVIPIRMTSYDASFVLDEKVDLIYIDGAHDEKNVFQDLYVWYPKLKENGIMCGDDWLWPGVRRAVIKFAKTKNLDIVNDGLTGFWYYKSKK